MVFLLSVVYWLLYIAFPADCLLPIAYCLLPFADCLLLIADCLLPIADSRLPTQHCLLLLA
jgi:hypothetical protein